MIFDEKKKSMLACRIAGMLLTLAVVMCILLPSGVNAAPDDNTGKMSLLDPFGNGGEYSYVLYDNTNGLPSPEVNAVVQTKDGFMWVGGNNGLVRFDGNRFELMSLDGLTDVSCLFADDNNRLWIGSYSSGLFLYDKDRLTHWGTGDGLDDASVRKIAADTEGNIYIATAKVMYAADSSLSLSKTALDGLSGESVVCLCPDGDGLMYCVSDAGELFTVRNGKMQSQIKLPDGMRAAAVLPDKDRTGHVYIGAADGVYYCRLDENAVQQHTYICSSYTGITDLGYTGDNVWMCCKSLIAMLPDKPDASGEDTAIVQNDFPMYSELRSIMQDRDGNIWVTSGRQGLTKITPNVFVDVSGRSKRQAEVVNTVCMYDDRLFVGTDNGLVVYTKSGLLSDNDDIPENDADKAYLQICNTIRKDNCSVRCIISDSRNRLWIASRGGAGLICRSGGKTQIFNAENGGLISDCVNAVCEQKDGSIIAAQDGGITVLRDGMAPKHYTAASGLADDNIITVTPGFDGEIIAGSENSGIYVIKDDTVRTLTADDGLTAKTILRLKHDRTRELIWVITVNSTAYMTPDHKLTTVSSFPSFNSYELFQNSRDEMWVLCGDGIYVMPTESIFNNDDKEPTLLSIKNGMPYVASNGSYSNRTESGDLYIAGVNGVIKVNIEADHSSEGVGFHPSVPYLEADGKRIYADESGVFTVPANTQKLTVYGYVFNYSIISADVSYCLEGFGSDYTTVSSEDLAPVDYTNLWGGEYSFVMKAVNPMTGDANEIAVTIVKEKKIYEHLWFVIMAVVLAVFLIALIAFLLFKRRVKKLVIKHNEEMEKQRINTELSTASNIQSGMLPSEFPAFPERTEFDLYASMDPAKEVGGDFYNFFMTDDDHLCMMIADVSGKGIPASLFMMSTMIAITDYAEIYKSPAEILTKANDKICRNNQEEMFVSVWLGILEISTGKLTAANAGHEYPALMQPDGAFELYKDKHGYVVGGMEGIRYKDYELTLKPGSKLFVYTDGVPEAMNSQRKMFEAGRMTEALNASRQESPEQILRNVRKAVDDFVGDAEQFDDLTMLCIEYKGKQ